MPDNSRVMPPWYDRWYRHLQQQGPRMSAPQQLASARLAVVLLCGEQSAIDLFSREVGQDRANVTATARRQLMAIEHDERLHENSLQALCEFLPVPDDRQLLRRRARRFFIEIGRTQDIAQHFARIAQLDSAVCKIMWHVQNSALDDMSPLKMLAQQIKNDEARHVSVSRLYASELGMAARQFASDRDLVSGALVQMLQPLGASFECIGVDGDRLFRHLRRYHKP